MRFLSWLLLGALVAGLAGVDEAQAAPAYRASGTFTAGTGAITPPYPASMAANDVCLLVVESENQAISLTTANGFAEVPTWSPQFAGTAATDPGSRLALFWKRTVGGDSAPVVADSGNHTTGQIHCFKDVLTSGNPWDTGAGGNDGGANDTTGVIPGSTTTLDDTLVVLIISTSRNFTSTTECSAWTNAGLTSLTEHTDNTDTAGLGGGHCMASGIKTSAGAYVDTTVTLANTSYKGAISLALKPVPTTTLGTGTDPTSPVSLNPGDGATVADAFTFKTNSGTDSVSAVVVGFATGTAAGLSKVEIINNAETTTYGEVIESGSGTSTITDTLTISLTTSIPVNTTETQYKIRITPKGHLNMPAPPGAIYNLTAKINSWTSTNLAAGSDTAGLTIAIDNLSSGDVTAASGTAGDTQVALTWTNPTDAAQVLVLRDMSSVVGPTEGVTTYGGSSTVVYVNNSPIPSQVINITDTGVTNGNTYNYVIYTRDSIGNYSVGVVPSGSPYLPSGPGCYAKATGNWESASTWAGAANGTGTCPGAGGVPDATTPVYITATTAYTVTVTTATAAAASVNINAPNSGTSVLAIGTGTLTVGGSVTVTGGTGTKKASLTFSTGTLKVGGTITDSGATVLTWGTGTVEYNGGGAQTVTNYGYHNLTINKSSGTATTSGNITIGNNLTLTTGTLNIAANSINGSGTGIVTLGSGSLLQIAAANFPSNYASVSIASNSTVEYNPSFNMTVPDPGGGQSYGNLLLSNSGNRAFNAAITVAGNLTASGTVALAMNAGITVNGTLTLGSGTSMDAKLYSHTLKGNFTNNGTFTPSTSTVTFSGTAAQAISGNATSFYNVAFNNSAGVTTSVDLSISGSFTNDAVFGAGSTTTTFNGTTAQSIGGASAPTFYNLTLNNAAGLTLSVNATVSSTLTFSSGSITTGTNTLILSSTSSCGVSGAGSGKYVVGKLRKSFNAATQTACDFEVGDSNATTHYTPVNVSFSGMSGSGTLTVYVKGGSGASATADDHPQIAGSGLDSANSLNRYWMLVPTGGFTFSNVTLTFTHLNDATWLDHDNTANVGRYAVKRLALSDANCYTGEAGYTGSGSWSTTTATGTQTVTSTAATGISSFGANCSHFAIGRGAISSFLREKEFIFQREVNY